TKCLQGPSGPLPSIDLFADRRRRTSMHRFLRRWPSPAMVVACIALAVALGGTSYAAFKLPKASVGTEQLKKASVGTAQLKENAVTSIKVKNGSLLKKDLKSGQLPAGPRGLPG